VSNKPFFENFDQFYSTSQTSPYPHRLNGRHQAIIGQSQVQLAGARVLDIASHDGRWSFAALHAGASHVTGIEPRQELINNAKETFSNYGINDSQYDFICGDVFDHLAGKTFDVIMCLGFYYHTIRHAELLDLMERTGARYIVIDTEVTPELDGLSPMSDHDVRNVFNNSYKVEMLRDPVDDQQMAFEDKLTRNGHTLVGRPSRQAIAYMAKHFGYQYSEYDWPAHFKAHPEHAEFMVDYSETWRGTYYLAR
jgi:hypothetical protein